MAVGEEAHELCVSLLWVEAHDASAISNLSTKAQASGWTVKSVASALETPGTMALVAKARAPWARDAGAEFSKEDGSEERETDPDAASGVSNGTGSDKGCDDDGIFWHLVDAGFIVGRMAADEAEIVDVAVLPGFRRRGIGRKLVEGLCRAAAIAGARRIFLEVAEDNSPAQLLYDELGFEAIAKRDSYYPRGAAGRVDAIVMRRNLPPDGGPNR